MSLDDFKASFDARVARLESEVDARIERLEGVVLAELRGLRRDAAAERQRWIWFAGVALAVAAGGRVVEALAGAFGS